jgi:membrane-bound inhibitor of C-type lysozyme
MTSHTVAAIGLLALAGCASLPSGGAWVKYRCSDGRTVEAKYPDATTSVIRLKGQTHTLHVALSGSGVRYTGDGWQWWTKGMRGGMLAPLAAGESIASAPGTQCHAR